MNFSVKQFLRLVTKKLRSTVANIRKSNKYWCKNLIIVTLLKQPNYTGKVIEKCIVVCIKN